MERLFALGSGRRTQGHLGRTVAIPAPAAVIPLAAPANVPAHAVNPVAAPLAGDANAVAGIPLALVLPPAFAGANLLGPVLFQPVPVSQQPHAPPFVPFSSPPAPLAAPVSNFAPAHAVVATDAGLAAPYLAAAQTDDMPPVPPSAANAPPTLAAASIGHQATSAGGPSSGDLPRVSIPPPVLNLDERLDTKKASARVRSFLRDVRLFFSVVSWGRHEPSCLLFMSQALRGIAKLWYDEWSLSQPASRLTVQSVIDALTVRFAPQIQTLETEARYRLRDLSFRMTSGETVAAYQSRLKAILSEIPSVTEEERRFWFLEGLSATLAPACASDFHGRPFSSYADLVQHAIGEEAKAFVRRRTQSSLRSHAAILQAVPDFEDDDADLPPAKKQRGAPRAAAAAVAPRGGAGVAGVWGVTAATPAMGVTGVVGSRMRARWT